MAHRVLAAPLAGALAVAALGGTPGATAELACRGGDADGIAFVQQAVGSPLYGWMAQRLGAPSACRIESVDGTLTATLAFPGASELRLSSSPVIEAASTVATLRGPAAAAEADLARVLHAFERWAAGPEGCGIGLAELRAAVASSAPTATAEGDTCNCRAEITRGPGGVREVRFGMAC